MTGSAGSHVDVESRCLCGGVRHRVEGRFDGIIQCHCQRCRKFHGSTFVSFAVIANGTYTRVSGNDLIERFVSADLVHGRRFCGVCGSPARYLKDESGRLAFTPVAGGILDGLPPPALIYHFYLAGKAPWFEPPAGAPHLYDIVHPDFRDPGLADLERSRTEGKICGSCLCGDVAFEATDPLFMMNCHCTRCRLSRGAAHATNLFVPDDKFAWISGADCIADYAVPGAERFGAAFCQRCGSLVPRPGTQRVCIPAGCLDSDPGLTPTGHIFVGSKASWFEIEDGLPRWDEAIQR